MYLNGVLPLDGYQLLFRNVPGEFDWGYGGYSLPSLPDAAFPSGKPAYGAVVGAGVNLDGSIGFWTVATYQGRAFADWGVTGVLSVSVILGLLFGSLYRVARRTSRLVALAVIGYVAYYTAYMIYDNLLSFSLIAVYDLAVLVAVDWLASGRVFIGRLARPLSPS